VILVALLLALSPVEGLQAVSGDAEIRATAGTSEIVIRTTNRLAGAIDSLTWNGLEFIDSADHGRQLQSASNLDAGSPITDETFNPTEAGSRADGAGPTSTSRLLFLKADGHRLETKSLMAFWLRPGEKSGPNPAKNLTALSSHGLAKTVTIGVTGLPHVIDYRVAFTLPGGEKHTRATFEALTGYLPPRFSRFLAYDPAAKTAKPLSDGPGEQPLPLIFSTEDGSHAMGAVSFDPGPVGYGRWNFREHRVVKWNCVFRERGADGLPAGDRSFRVLVAVGSLDDVVRSLAALHALHGR
jgi:hypothetical protein